MREQELANAEFGLRPRRYRIGTRGFKFYVQNHLRHTGVDTRYQARKRVPTYSTLKASVFPILQPKHHAMPQ